MPSSSAVMQSSTPSDTAAAERRLSRGRPFRKGNSGRPKGSKNRSTAVVAQLIESERENLVRKSFDLALEGNEQLLKFLLARLIPKDRLIKIDLPPINHVDDAIDALAAINRAISIGEITPSEAAAIAQVVQAQVKAIEAADIVRRVNRIEAKVTGFDL